MSWQKKRVLVTVKAYPERSQKHGFVVCTAGLTEDGEWIRLYPIPYRFYSGRDKVKKYDWIEVECKKTKEKLNRKESYRIRADSMQIVDRSLSEGRVKGRVNWAERNKLVLGHAASSIEDLREAFTEDRTSLGLVKPSELIEFYKERELRIYRDENSFQQDLFGAGTPVVTEIPHIFGYRFRCAGCAEGAEHRIQCEDWELFESYRSWGPRYGDTGVLWEKLTNRYYTDMLKNDLYFYVGTSSLFPSWLIIGLYYPPRKGETQLKPEGIKGTDRVPSRKGPDASLSSFL